MPNHVTHRVVVTGPTIAAFKERCVVWTEDEGVSFDFNTLIPMPEEVKNTESSSTVTNGMAVLAYEGNEAAGLAAEGKTIRSMLGWPWVAEKGIVTEEALVRYLIDHDMASREKALAHLAVKKKYGVIDWYDWSITYWGTKWNAYGFSVVSDEPDRFEFRFDTAWSVPEPFFQKLADMLPGLVLKFEAFDEGWNFAVAGSIVDGRCDIREIAADKAVYERVYGEEPETVDEEA